MGASACQAQQTKASQDTHLEAAQALLGNSHLASTSSLRGISSSIIVKFLLSSAFSFIEYIIIAIAFSHGFNFALHFHMTVHSEEVNQHGQVSVLLMAEPPSSQGTNRWIKSPMESQESL